MQLEKLVCGHVYKIEIVKNRDILSVVGKYKMKQKYSLCNREKVRNN